MVVRLVCRTSRLIVKGETMTTNNMIFVSMPVKDLQKSVQFFAALGYEFNPKFTGDDTACVIISDSIHAMLLTHDKFKNFAPHAAITDTSKAVEMLLTLSCASRSEVDDLVKKAIAAG